MSPWRSLAGLSSAALLSDLALLLVYWLTSSGSMTLSIAAVVHASAGAVLCLFTVGHSLRVAFGGSRFITVSLRGRVAFDVVLSIISLMASSVGLSALFLLNGRNVMLILGTVIVASDMAQLAKPRVPFKAPEVAFLRAVPLIAIVSVGLIIALIFRQGFAWPSMPGWDVYVHLATTNWIVAHGGVTDIFQAGKASAAPYPYLFYVLVASLSEILRTTPYAIFWFGPYFSIPLYGTVVYAIASILTGSRLQSVIAALLAMSVSGGETLLGPQYFFPSTAFILLFILCLVAIVDSPLHGVAQATFAVVALSLCYVLYYFPLFLTLPAVVICLLVRNREPAVSRIKSLVLTSALVSSILLTYIGSILLPGQGLTLAQDVSVLGGAYPDILLLLIAFGAVVMLYQSKLNNSKYLIQLGIVAYVLTLLGVYFLPVVGSDRSELLFRPFMAVVASYGILSALGAFLTRSPTGAKSGRIAKSGQLTLKLFTVLLLIISAAFLIQPYVKYGHQVAGFSNISNDEFQASAWLAKNTPGDGYILTDPSTGTLLRGLTVINSSTAFIEHGHTPSPQDNFTLTSVIYDFFTTQNLTEAQVLVNELPQSPNFVVVTTRTASWASWGGINSTFSAPTSDAPNSFAGFQKFTTPMFSLVASWNTVKIYIITDTRIEQISQDLLSPNNLGPWYLDGAYGNYSAHFNNGSMQIAVQSSGVSNAWTGPSLELSNSSSLSLLQIAYQINTPVYALELLLWQANGSSTIYDMSQSPGLNQMTISLSSVGNNSLTRVSIVLWTRDTQLHDLSVGSMELYGYVIGQNQSSTRIPG